MNDEIEINGKEYVLKSSVKTVQRQSISNKKYVIVRTKNAGVFAGYLKKRAEQTVTLQDARRIWYWKGAASLSQLSKDGTSNPDGCKFPEAVDEVLLFETIEILPVSEKAKKSILSVKVWKE